MMADVYDISRHFRPLLAKHLAITTIIQEMDQLQQQKAYVAATFLDNNTSKIQLAPIV